MPMERVVSKPINQFYICTSSNVILPTLPSLIVSPSSEMRGKGTILSAGKCGAMPALPSEQNEETSGCGFFVSRSQMFSGFILLEGEATMGPLCPKGSKIRKQSQDSTFYIYIFSSLLLAAHFVRWI